MPYIDMDKREQVRRDYVEKGVVVDAGDAAYLIADVIDSLLPSPEKRRYADLATADGVLSGAVDEFRRQVVHPYEDAKREKNGAVYEA